MSTTKQKEQDRAKEQAKAQYRVIIELMERLEHATECGDRDCPEHGSDDYNSVEDYHDADKARDAIVENALECQVRSGWESNKEDLAPQDFQILLCTGGPAVRILGELDEYGGVHRAWIQYQDWYTAWTDLYIPDSSETIKAYASEFYYA